MRLYLAHPFDSRAEMRQWQLHLQVVLDIEIINPFYDLSRTDVGEIDAGRVGRYENIDTQELVERDLLAIKESDGVIAYINGEISYGTIMEIVYAHLFGLPVYLVCTNGHSGHPWLQYHSESIFTSKEECEKFLQYEL